MEDCLIKKQHVKNNSRKVISPDGGTDTFEIQAGVLQGETLAPFLFIKVFDYCLRMAIPDDRAHTLGFTIKPGQWRKIGKQIITDLGFAVDLALLSDTVEQVQEILLALETEAANVDLHINAKKTQYISFNQTSLEPLRTVNGSKLQQVQDFLIGTLKK